MSKWKQALATKRIWITVLLVTVITLLLGAGVFHELSLVRSQQDFVALLEENDGSYNEGRLVLSSTNSREAQKIADTIGGSLRVTKNGQFALVTLPDNTTLLDVAQNRELRKYMAKFSLDYNDFSLVTEDMDVAADGDIRANFQTDEPMYPQQTYLDYINIGDSWNVHMDGNTDGEKMTIAVIDSGIDTDHPEFTDAEGNSIISMMSYNATNDKLVNTNGISVIEDEQGHGTAVAGVIAAQINGIGIMGIAPNVELLVIKCDVDDTGEFKSSADIVFGIYYAIEQDVDVINMSFGIDKMLPDMKTAIQLAVDSNIIIVASAGNNSSDSPHYPAAWDITIGVGALAQDSWDLADYSNYGVNSDIVAPGTTLTAMMGGNYSVREGTSMAAPIVAAAVTIYRSQHPYATFAQVKNDLLAAGKDLGYPGEDGDFGFGVLDMNAFICEQKGIITYDYCTEDMESITQVFVRQHTIQTVPEPERENVIFDDWYYDKAYTRAFDYDTWYTTEFVEDIKLYAKWVNEDDEGTSVYNYRPLSDGTIEIVKYKGKRRYLTIPNEIDGQVVSAIGASAFAGNTRLRAVTFPEGLISIKESAFSNVSGMREITFTGTRLVEIQGYAFYNCSALKTLALPDSVQNIGEYAFYACNSLTTVSIGENSSLCTMGEFAFSNTRISSFYLPRHVGAEAFDGSVLAFCASMRSVTVHPENSAFMVDGNTLYSADKRRIIYHPGALTGNYSVDAGVDTIGTYAFSSSHITSINLNSVKEIEAYAFIRNNGLSSVVIPNSVDTMGVGAFQFSSVNQVTLSKNLTELSAYVFEGTKLKSVHIPAQIRSIQEKAFRNCSFLYKLTFDADSELQTIKGAAFQNCCCLTDFQFPQTLCDIGKNAFEKCYAITSLFIPTNVFSIGNGAFRYCQLLQQVSFADDCILNKIPDDCFSNCTLLHTVNFSDGIKSLGMSAFSNDYMLHTLNFGANSGLTFVDSYCFYACSSLKDMQLPDNVSRIGKFAYAFSGLTAVDLSANVVSVGDATFGACYSLETITVDENNAAYAAFDDVLFNKAIDTVYCVPSSRIGSYTLPQTVKITAPYSFYYDKHLTAVTLPDGLEEIRMNSFYGCSSLAGVLIPASVTNIGRQAFEDCTNLSSVSFEENSKLQRLGIYTFVNCGLTEITIPASVESMAQYVFCNCDEMKTLRFEKNSKMPYMAAYLLKGTCVETVVFEDGSALTSLQAHAFDGAEYLKSIDFGDAAVTNIDNYAFYGCINLESMELPGEVTYIGSYAFYNCEKLCRMDIPAAVDYIGTSAFLGTTNMKVFFAADELPANVQFDWDKGILGYFLGAVDYVVTDEWEYSVRSDGTIALAAYKGLETTLVIDVVDGRTVSRIGARCFYENDALTSVSINNHITEIGNYAFYGCDALADITIPAAVERIGKYAFADTGTVVTLAEDSQLKTIDSYAFFGNASTVFSLPDSVTHIGDGAFSGSALTVFTINESSSLISIGREAFVGTGIAEIHLPVHLETIGENAFKDVDTLVCVEIAESKTSLMLSNSAFEGCGIHEITIPARVNYIGEYAFGRCLNLENIHVDPSNTAYTDLDGVLCDITGTTLIQYPCDRSGAYEIPAQITVLSYSSFKDAKGLTEVTFAEGSTVKTIGWKTFSGCDSLENITVPDTIVSIDFYAFENCIVLTTVILSEENQLTGVYEGAFYNCTALENIMLPNTVVEIGDYAFYHCSSLTALPITADSAVTGIYDHAFDGCTGITEIPALSQIMEIGEYAFAYTGITEYTVPASLKNIAMNSFHYCESFSSIYCDKSNEEYSVIDGALYEKGASSAADYDALVIWPYGNPFIIGEGKNTVTASDTIICNNAFVPVRISDTVTTIDRYAFYDRDGLTNIQIPDSVKTIHADAFKSCDNLSHVVIPESVLNMKDYIFSGCPLLETAGPIGGDYDIEYGWSEYIPDYAFDCCNHLRSVVFPDGLQKIGYSAFRDCINLTQIVIPESVTTIDGNAFNGCNSLRSVVFPDGLLEIGMCAFYECRRLESVIIAETVTSMGSAVFKYCDMLKTAGPIGGGYNIEFAWTTRIPENAFSSCSLVSVTLPETVTELGAYAFDDCSNLAQINIPDGMVEIGEYAFWNCDSLSHVTLPDSVQTLGYSLFSNCALLNTAGPVGSSCNIWLGWNEVIPDHVLTALNALTYLQIPTGVSEIGENYCSSILEKIIIPESVVSVQEGFLSRCSKLTTAGPIGGDYAIEFAETGKIPDNLFSKLEYLESVVISDGITEIGANAFIDCSGLSSITIPRGVKKIGMSAFEYCCNVEQIYFDAIEMEDLGYCNNVFDNVGSNTSGVTVTIGAQVTKIPAYLFDPHNDGMDLASVTFEENSVCSYIGTNAFHDCDSLDTIRLPVSVAYVGRYAFGECPDLLILLSGDQYPAECGYLWSGTSTVLLHARSLGTDENGYDYCITYDDKVILYRYRGTAQNLVIPDQIQSMDIVELTGRLFENHTEFISVSIPDTVQSIGEYAFSGCTQLTNVSFPASLRYIGSYAFNNCAQLLSLNLPDSVTFIGEYAFFNCKKASELSLPQKLETIGFRAFMDCQSITGVTIPEGVVSIGNGAFENCYRLKYINYNAASANDLSVTIFHNSGNQAVIRFGKKVERIPAGLFYSSYGDRSPGIFSIEFEEGSICTSIGENAFRGCTKLVRIELPKNLTTLGEYAFVGCTGVEEFYYNAAQLELAGYGYRYFENLGSNGSGVELTIGRDVLKVPDRFMECATNLRPQNNLVRICFEEGTLCESIGKNAFASCLVLQEAILPPSVTVIGEEAFWYCTAMESVTMPPDIQIIGDGTFNNCLMLKSVCIPQNVLQIKDNAFYNCTSLGTVQIDSPTIAGGISHKNSTGFLCSYANTIVLPAHITEPGQFITTDFQFTEDLMIDGESYISFSDHAHAWKLFGRTHYLECVQDGVDEYQCEICGYIKRNIRPAHDLIVAEEKKPTCLEDGYIYYVCNRCGYSIAEFLPKFGDHVLGDWYTVTDGTQNDPGESRRDCANCDYSETGTFTTVASGICGLTAEWVLKGTGELWVYGSGKIFDYDYSSQPWSKYRAAISSVYLEDSITYIGRRAFEKCSNLTSVHFGNGITEIGSSAFYDCVGLADIVIPDMVTTIGEYTFMYCTELRNVQFGSGIRSIPARIFSGCTSLRSISIPDTITSIGSEAFSECSELEYVSIPVTVSEMGSSVFRNCPALCTAGPAGGGYNLEFGWTTVIPARAFHACSKLITVHIPETIQQIENYVFSYCTSLEKIIFYGNAPEMSSAVLSGFSGIVQYPAENKTWTEDVRGDYSGSPTWMGVCMSVPHMFGEWDEITEATCIHSGEACRYCYNCEYAEFCVIDMLGHSFTDYISDNNATCTQDGTKTAFCDRCDAFDTVIDTGSAHGHEFTDWTVIQEPTENMEGLESRYCLHCGIEETRTVACLENPFADVPAGSFYYEPVMWAVDNGVTNGTSTTTFGPNDQCMRAHVVTFLWRAVGSPEPTRTDNPFVDVKPADFYYKPVLWAVENGITSGMDATHFGPTAYCNRAQVVTFLYRTMGNPDVGAAANPFTDVAVGSFYERAVLWAVENGVTAGLSATSFGPNSICNRAQIATFLYRAFVNE